MLSIQNQYFTDYEVIIVDGDSRDGTISYLKSLQPPFFYHSEQDSGVYEAMNKGVKMAKGDWFCFLGADDQFANSSVLEEVQKQLENQFQVVFGNVIYSDTFKKIFQSKWASWLWFSNRMHHQSMFYNKDVFKDHTFSEGYKILSDYELTLKLYKEKIAVKKIELSITNCGSNGVSKNYNWSLYKEEIEIKTKLTSGYLKPIFFLLGLLKFLVKKTSTN